MFRSNNRRKSTTSKKPRSRPFGKLTIDTKCVNQRQVFPYESRVQELSFVSFQESKARKDAHSRKPAEAKKHLHHPQHQHQHQPPMPFHRRVEGLRPSPLNLNQDVSPSDRVIPIGISMSPLTSGSRTPSSPILKDMSHKTTETRDPSPPTIVITPAKDSFSTPEIQHHDRPRPVSSIYSRYTNCMTNPGAFDRTPPVPPLPLFVNTNLPQSRFSDVTATTTFEDLTPLQTEGRSRSISTRKMSIKTADGGRLTPGLPTPRRSKGWWNVITSPFSASSAATPFWRSPTSGREPENIPVLSDAASMGIVQPRARVDCAHGRPYDDLDDVCSAPPANHHTNLDSILSRSLPKRSVTAPGALDANGNVMNIYQTPSTGAAATYYDTNRYFPSICMSSKPAAEHGNEDVRGWSPSQSVYQSPHEPKSCCSESDSPGFTVMEAALEAYGITRSDSPTTDDGSMSPKPAWNSNDALFSTPSEDELRTPPVLPGQQMRSMTQTTHGSAMSPLSATPTVQNAYMGRVVGPTASFAEQREVNVEHTTIPLGPSLAEATMAHSDRSAYHDEKTQEDLTSLQHKRQDSYGLGISDGANDLFPPPAHVSEKPRLGTDRYGQLTVHTGGGNSPRRPWYRRSFWLLASCSACWLMMSIVLLVTFVQPRQHRDTHMQAVWLNLTQFPPLATGFATVVKPSASTPQSSCVSPKGLWTCTSPASQASPLPDFRFEIRFNSSAFNVYQTALPGIQKPVKRWQIGAYQDRRIKRSFWDLEKYQADPQPPSTNDQKFLGRTTDNASEPYDGEPTPFYLTFHNQAPLPGAVWKRDAGSSYPYPDDDALAQNSTASTAAAEGDAHARLPKKGKPEKAVLYPLYKAQPLRLYNRGQDSEHYGFYNYFNRTVYINGTSALSQLNSATLGSVDLASDVAHDDATAACTFSQTRILVQIWTRKGTVRSLDNDPRRKKPSDLESAVNDVSSPGSFPYPVTVTLDRHGGDASKKGVFCYSIGDHGHVMSNATWIVEDRAVGGSLINPAAVPGSSVQARDVGDGDGGVDGGSGGCSCQWKTRILDK